MYSKAGAQQMNRGQMGPVASNAEVNRTQRDYVQSREALQRLHDLGAASERTRDNTVADIAATKIRVTTEQQGQGV